MSRVLRSLKVLATCGTNAAVARRPAEYPTTSGRVAISVSLDAGLDFAKVAVEAAPSFMLDDRSSQGRHGTPQRARPRTVHVCQVERAGVIDDVAGDHHRQRPVDVAA